jgi:hypothetical protein
MSAVLELHCGTGFIKWILVMDIQASARRDIQHPSVVALRKETQPPSSRAASCERPWRRRQMTQ